MDMTDTEHRELDAQVAVEVMGWDPQPYNLFVRLFKDYSEKEKHRVETQRFYIPMARSVAYRDTLLKFGVNTLDLELKYYSTSISAAWEVVERMILRSGDKPEEHIRFVELLSLGKNPYGGQAPENKLLLYPQSAPLTICRAALAAVRDE